MRADRKGARKGALRAYRKGALKALRIAGSMLQNGLDKETVQKITGLSADELKPLYC